MMNGRFDLCECCHARHGPRQNIQLHGLNVRKGKESVQEHLVHKLFEDIDGLKRSIWLLSPRSTTRTNFLITDLEPRLADFMPIMDISDDKHALNDNMDVKMEVNKIIGPDPHAGETDVYSTIRCPNDHTVNSFVKCPVTVLQYDNHVARLDSGSDSVPGSSDCHSSTWRQPGVGRRIIANFNQVTSERSTNNLRDQVDQLTISGSGKIHSHTNNKCGSTIAGRAVLSHSNNSAFVNPQIAEDMDSSMDKLSDVNHNSSGPCLHTIEEVTNNNTPTPSVNGEYVDPELEYCDCDSCMLEEETQPPSKPLVQRVKYSFFLIFIVDYKYYPCTLLLLLLITNL